MSSVIDLQALLDGHIDPKTIHLTRQSGATHTTETYQGSVFQLQKNMVTMSKGGKDTDRRLYEAAASRDILGVMTFLHNGIPGAKDFTKYPGFGIYEMKPNNPNHLAAVGNHGNFREVFAKKANFKDWRAAGTKLTPSYGWNVNHKTPLHPGRHPPAGEIPNKHRMIIFHNKDCNFFNGGPPNMGGNKHYAKVRRDNKDKKRLAKLEKVEEVDDWKPAATKRRRVSPSNDEDPKPAAKPAASDRASRYAARATAKK